MDSSATIKKLKEFLMKHPGFKEECEVVYLMVEIRKILDTKLDTKKEENLSTLRFYCNWVLHNELDRQQTTAFLRSRFAIDDADLSARDIARKLKDGHISFFKLNDFKNRQFKSEMHNQ